MPLGNAFIEPTTPMPLKNSKNPTFWPKEPNRPLTWGPMKKVPMYNSTAAATAPPSDPRPPMTGMARTAIEMSAVNCVGDTLCQSRAQKTPALAATKPDKAKTRSLTVAGLIPKEALARSLSLTAMTTRPIAERRSAAAAATTTTSTTKTT